MRRVKEWQLLSHGVFLTPWTLARHAPLSMESSRQEYWSELSSPSPRDLPDPGIEPRSPALQRFLNRVAVIYIPPLPHNSKSIISILLYFCSWELRKWNDQSHTSKCVSACLGWSCVLGFLVEVMESNLSTHKKQILNYTVSLSLILD